jgi:hypothetical protein
MCEDRQKLRRTFDEAAEAFAAVVPGFRELPQFDPADLESAVMQAAQRVEEAADALERHARAHRC